MWGHRDIMEAMAVISAQVHNCEHMLIILLAKSGIEIPPELINAGKALSTKTKALQAALDAQAQKPK